MSLFPSFVWIPPAKAYPYQVLVPPSVPAIDLATLKLYLKIDPPDTTDDSILTLIAASVEEYAQNFTKRTFLNTTFQTFRDAFYYPYFELRRCQFQELLSFQYLVNGVFTDVDATTYYITASNDFSQIVLKYLNYWPMNADIQLQAIRIQFVAGYGDDPSSIPVPLMSAMLSHCASIYANRGDWDSADMDTMSTISSVPREAYRVYNQYRIAELTTTSSCI